MVARADAVLAAIPVLAVSGLALRTAITVTGIGTTLLTVPLTVIGVLAAATLVVRELLFGPVATKSRNARS